MRRSACRCETYLGIRFCNMFGGQEWGVLFIALVMQCILHIYDLYSSIVIRIWGYL